MPGNGVDQDFNGDEFTATNTLVVRSREITPSMWHTAVSMLLLRLMRVLSVSLLFSAAQGEAQVPTEHPELIAGPWEVASTSGIEGIFFEIVTSSSGATGREQFDWQTMNIRVYHREGGKEPWGYVGTKDKAKTSCATDRYRFGNRSRFEWNLRR